MENIEHYNSELFCTKKMLILKKWLFCCLRRDTQACGSSASHCQSRGKAGGGQPDAG